MSPYILLAALLLLAWAASVVAHPRGRHGLGLGAGAEFLLVGIFLGPAGANLITRATLDGMASLTLAAASWLALLAGSHLVHLRGGSLRRRLAGLAMSIATFVAGAGLAWIFGPLLLALEPGERLPLALGLGCASSETARSALAWSACKLGAHGKLQQALMDLAEFDDVVPLVGLAALFALAPRSIAVGGLDAPLWLFLATLATGVVMGALAAALTRLKTRSAAQTIIVLGTALVVTGATARAGLAAPAALMTMGMTVSVLARNGRRLHAVLAATARPVLLPVIALAGASLELHDGWALWLVAAMAPFARLAVKLPVLARFRFRLAPPSAPTPAVGLALLACGPVSVCVGLTVAAEFPGPVGRTVLAACLVSIVLGDVIGRLALRHELARASEVHQPRVPPSATPEAPA